MDNTTTNAVATAPVTANDFVMTVPNQYVFVVNNIISDMKLALTATPTEDGMVYSGKLTPEKEVALKNKIQVMSLKNGLKSIVSKTGGFVADTADVVVNDVAVPVAKVGFKTVASVGRIGAKATVLSAASIINSVASEGGRAVHDIKKSEEFHEAKKNVTTAKNKLFGLFGLVGQNDKIKFG